MMYQNLVNVLERVRNTTKTSEKEQLLNDAKNLPHFKRLVNYLCDDFQVVGLSTKKLEKTIQQDSEMNLTELLDYLLEHPTGTDTEIALVNGFLNRLPKDQADVLRQVIAKTWPANIGAKLANKVFGSDFVPTFEVQLAYAYDKKEKQITDDEVFYATQKLDGYRLLAFVDKEKNELKSRKGKTLTGVSELINALRVWVDQNPLLANTKEPFVLDGEALAKNPDQLTSGQLFQKTSKALSSKAEAVDITFNIFDILTLSEFKKGESNHPYHQRRELVLNNLTDADLIKIVPVEAVITKKDIPYWSDRATSLGWEGIMLNKANGRYQTKRTPNLIKVKKMHTADLEIIGFEEAIDGNFKGSLQAIRCRLGEENTILVGSGMSIEERHHIWQNQDDYLGKIVEIKYFEETTNQNGGRSLRFPVFKGIRFDKTPDDVNID